MRGMSLIEVMVSLVIVCISLTSLVRLVVFAEHQQVVFDAGV